MQQVLGYSALHTGFAWLAMCVTSLAFAGPAQVLVTKLGVRPVLVLGMMLIAGGIALAIRAPVGGRFWADLAAPMVVTGAGTAFAFIPISIAGLTGVTEADSGVASGLINTTQQLGGSLGVALAATVAATRTASLMASGHPAAAALTGGFQRAFLVAAAIGAIGIVLAFIVPRQRKVPGQAPTADPAFVTTESNARIR